MGDSATIKALKKLTNELPNLVETIAKAMMFNTYDDRAAGIIAVVDLQEALKMAISTKMVALKKTETDELFSGFGPLASFSAQIKIAYALGVIGRKTKRDLDIIRHIRNAFAHGKKRIDFKTKEIAQGCKLLSLPSRAKIENKEPWPPTEPKELFQVTTHMLRTALVDLKLDTDLGDYPLD